MQIKEDFYTEHCARQNLKRAPCAPKLRTGALSLPRYKDASEEQCLCVLCDLVVVKDEFHFGFYHPLCNNLKFIVCGHHYYHCQIVTCEPMWAGHLNKTVAGHK